MLSGAIPDNEDERLTRLRELGIMDTLEEQAYDDLTKLASQICDAPIALVSLIDENRQWFKSHHGIDATETPRNVAFCAHAINSNDLFIIEDADHDERFHDNPLVTSEPFVKFYAGAPLILDKNIRIGTLCVIDNHARKITDRQKESLEALARQVVSQLKLRLQLNALKNLDHAKDEFLSMVSHELRTPLTALKGSLGILNHHANELSEEMETMLDIAVRNSEQLLVIVNDILDLSKMEAGKLVLALDQVNLVELIDKAIELNISYVKQCNCQISLQITESKKKPLVMGDQQRLLQVLSNLISNAAKFSTRGTDILIELKIDTSQARINIINQGAGIPPEQQDQLFKKFSQLIAIKNQKLPGTGLGLNICKHIIEAHNGTIDFESIPNQKTTFYFKLDLVD
ncbi:MAG: GAF domain-containing sensor histidine kinase [Gammaproteobacteria bacterium]|nr:GAF domain-containing sensor histidine kinase [Gammaproteobacteria bacterium]